VTLVRHRQTKGPATDRLHLHHRATSRLYHPPVTETSESVALVLGSGLKVDCADTQLEPADTVPEKGLPLRAFHEKAGLCQCIRSVQEELFTIVYPSSMRRR
jgi:hypothetical protein